MSNSIRLWSVTGWLSSGCCCCGSHSERERARARQEHRTHTSHPEEISTFPVLGSPLLSWPFLLSCPRLWLAVYKPVESLPHLNLSSLCLLWFITVFFAAATNAMMFSGHGQRRSSSNLNILNTISWKAHFAAEMCWYRNPSYIAGNTF